MRLKALKGLRRRTYPQAVTALDAQGRPYRALAISRSADWTSLATGSSLPNSEEKQTWIQGYLSDDSAELKALQVAYALKTDTRC
jgi:hypothetical protein